MPATVDIPHLSSVGCHQCGLLWKERNDAVRRGNELATQLAKTLGLIAALRQIHSILHSDPLLKQIDGITGEAKLVLFVMDRMDGKPKPEDCTEK